MKNPRPDIDAHMPGVKRGEEWAGTGRKNPDARAKYEPRAMLPALMRAKAAAPIDPRMPNLPPS